MKITTYNLNGICARLPRLLEWLEREKPDVVCLQELKSTVAQVPAALCELQGYRCYWHGERAYSGEGLVGFAWAFLRAGAQRVVAGLWDVDDRSTAELMDLMYARIAAGEPPASALRSAKLTLVGRSNREAKPYYWAPFELFTVTP